PVPWPGASGPRSTRCPAPPRRGRTAFGLGYRATVRPAGPHARSRTGCFYRCIAPGAARGVRASPVACADSPRSNRAPPGDPIRGCWRHRSSQSDGTPDPAPAASGMESYPSSPVRRSRNVAAAIRAPAILSGRASATALLRPSTGGASRGSPPGPGAPDVQPPAHDRNRHSAPAATLAPRAASKLRGSSGSNDALATGVRFLDPLRCADVSAIDVSDDPSRAAAARLRPASDDLLRLAAAPLTAPALSCSTRFAPFPSRPPIGMKPDISTLHKPDILILRRQGSRIRCGAGAPSV